MPVEFPEFSGYVHADPRPVLIKFLQQLRDFLDEIVTTDADSLGSQGLFLHPLLEDMRAAWTEARPNFDGAIDRLSNLDLDRLRQHGLYGRQLRFKLAVIRFFYSRYLGVGRGILRKLIDIIDDLLKSLLDAMGTGGAISEIKDFIKDSLDD